MLSTFICSVMIFFQQAVFDTSYDQRRIARFSEAFGVIYKEHGPDDTEPLQWCETLDSFRTLHNSKDKDLSSDWKRRDPYFDMTTKQGPMPEHLRLQFR